MREIIDIKIGTQKTDVLSCKTDLLCLGQFADAKQLNKVNKQLNKNLDGAVEQLIKLGDFKGKERTHALIYGNDKISAKRVLLVGLGDNKKATLDTLRTAAAYAANQAVSLKAVNVAFVFHQAFGKKINITDMGQAIAEGICFGAYRYDEFQSDSENGRSKSLKAELIDTDSTALRKLSQGVTIGSAIGAAQNIARTIANRPANVMYPEQLAKQAKAIAARTANLTCTVFDEKQLKQKKMGGIIAVGQGSSHKPCMIVLKYTPRAPRKVGTVGLIGKAITFDSGGISIKPSAHMDQMKMDKTGGAVTLGAIKAIADLKLPVEVCAVICAAENAPGADSYRPGDVITTYSGKTVEILNTDAEGRMVLCDGIAYAKQSKCEPIIDVATLTGACMVALGKHKAGLMGNDDALIRELQTAAQQSGEALWHMPCGDEYAEELKSKIADLKNIGSKYGGACTAASFLGEFAGDTKWAHLDIAGKMDPSEPLKKITADGSIGFGVRLLTAYLTNLTKKAKR